MTCVGNGLLHCYIVPLSDVFAERSPIRLPGPSSDVFGEQSPTSLSGPPGHVFGEQSLIRLYGPLGDVFAGTVPYMPLMVP